MIKKSFIFSFIFCSLSVFAQKDLKTGFIVLGTNDTMVGTLKNKNYYSKGSVKLYQENNVARFSKRILSEIHVEDDICEK